MFFKLIIISALLLNIAYAGGEAAFGLNWGETIESIKNKKVDLSLLAEEDGLKFYKCSTLPKDISDVLKYYLIFDDSSRLVKITAEFMEIKNDPYGREGKNRFANLDSLLCLKYAPGKSYQYSGYKLYQESDEFYECLAYEGCGTWIKFYKAENKSAILQLKGIGRGNGFAVLTIESCPEFKNALERSNKIKADKESSAF
jgi:hypothetical protein